MSDTVIVYVDSEDSTVVRSHDDVCASFADMLNGSYPAVSLGGIDYDYSQVWRSTDEAAYREAELDYFADYTEVEVPWRAWVDDDADVIEAVVTAALS